jgi:hypothetical protein
LNKTQQNINTECLRSLIIDISWSIKIKQSSKCPKENTLDKRQKNVAIAIAAIVVLSVAAISIVTIFTPSTLLHYERDYTGSRPVFIGIAGLEDCILNLKYENNEVLMYRIDIELYSASEPVYFEYRGGLAGDYEHFVLMNWEDHYGDTTHAKSMNITLGTGHAYEITLGGDPNSRNVTSYVVFSNNATLGNRTFTYLFPGTLNLNFGENVNSSKGGFDMEIGETNFVVSSVSMTINLPATMDGNAVFTSNSTSVTTNGWTLYNTTSTTESYRTSETLLKPLLDIDKVYATTLVADLMA